MLNKKNLLVTNHHQDMSGGGTHVMMMLNILKDYFNIYVDDNVEYYSLKETPFHLDHNEVKKFDDEIKPDLHLLASYRGWVEPKSINSLQLCYFPVKKKLDGWKYFMSINDFVSRNIKINWSRDSFIVPPYFDMSSFAIDVKSETCISVGNYFLEKDGHSKNQHLLIEWFIKNAEAVGLKNFILHGYKNNDAYFKYLQELIDNDPRIQLKSNTSFSELHEDLAKSKFLLHAMGYNRNPRSIKLIQKFGLLKDRIEQVEHFGFVAVESLLSGTQPIVHNSGGCPEIRGVLTYNQLEEVEGLIKNNPNPDVENLRQLGEIYNAKKTRDAIENMLCTIFSIQDIKFI